MWSQVPPDFERLMQIGSQSFHVCDSYFSDFCFSKNIKTTATLCFLKNRFTGGLGEMTQWLIKVTECSEDPGSISSSHMMMAHNCNSFCRGSDTLTQTIHTGNINAHKVQINSFKTIWMALKQLACISSLKDSSPWTGTAVGNNTCVQCSPVILSFEAASCCR